jgi:hypothetical protein
MWNRQKLNKLILEHCSAGTWRLHQPRSLLHVHFSPLLSSGQTSRLQIRRSGVFWELVGLERGPLSLVSTTEELLGRKSSSRFGLESRDYGRRDPSRWPRDTTTLSFPYLSSFINHFTISCCIIWATDNVLTKPEWTEVNKDSYTLTQKLSSPLYCETSC